MNWTTWRHSCSTNRSTIKPLVNLIGTSLINMAPKGPHPRVAAQRREHTRCYGIDWKWGLTVVVFFCYALHREDELYSSRKEAAECKALLNKHDIQIRKLENTIEKLQKENILLRSELKRLAANCANPTMPEVDAAPVTAPTETISNGKPDQSELEGKLKALVNKHDIMLFMKGNRNAPRCGFSNTIIQLLNQTTLDYETFDILENEEVRQGLKDYSNWQTYPQLYYKGELVGGLDIVKKLHAGNELYSTLTAKAKFSCRSRSGP